MVERVGVEGDGVEEAKGGGGGQRLTLRDGEEEAAF